MKRMATALLLQFTFVALAAAAQSPAAAVAASGSAIVVAHDGRVDVFDAAGKELRWSTEGVALPSFIVSSRDQFALFDSLANVARLIDVGDRRAITITTGETPVAAAFVGDDLFVVERDAARLARHSADGRATGFVALAADPAFLRVAGERLYVYSRSDGVVHEISPQRLEIERRATLPPGASDFELDGRTGYLAYPRDAKLRTFARQTMAPSGEISVGAVPLDIAFAADPNALSARRLAIADPSSKRVWVIEGRQSVTQAFLRGFVRGLIGLGLAGNRNASFPTGVDRVVLAGRKTFAYDSSSGTVYRLEGKKTTIAATGVAPAAFAVSGDTLAVWSDGRVRLLR